MRRNDLPLTETLRLGDFGGSDQLAWETMSKTMISDIVRMLQTNQSLLNIYNYARIQRSKIASQLNHTHANRFGLVRVRDTIPEPAFNTKFGDDYTLGAINGSPTDPTLFAELIKLINSQMNIFQRQEIITPFTLPNNDRIVPDGKTRYFKYYSPLNAVSVQFIVKIDLQAQTNEIIHIVTQFLGMNETIYKNHILQLEYRVKKLLQPEIHENEALFRIGMLAHELSNAAFLLRGSAAVNGWIIRAIAELKGIKLENLRVGALPFDICAHFLKDSVQYAIAFATTHNPNFIMNPIYIKRFEQQGQLQHFLYLIQNVIALENNYFTKHLGIPFFASADFVPLIALNTELGKIIIADISYADALTQMQQKLLPFVGLNPNPVVNKHIQDELRRISAQINDAIHSERRQPGLR